jgi:hypothetical protein
MDTHVNTFGRKLLELCKTTQMLILNGRHLGDKGGKFTFFCSRGMSVNDYCIVSNSMWSLVNNFRIDDFNEFSDHAPLVAELQRLNEKGIGVAEETKAQVHHMCRWNENDIDDIKKSLLDNYSDLRELVSNIDDQSSESINSGVHEFLRILDKITEKCQHKVLIKNPLNAHNRTKPWFDEKCRSLRNEYIGALSIFNRYRNNANREILTECKTKYKKETTKKKRNFMNWEGNSLSYMRKHNPKLFHRRFRKKKKQISTNISTNEFYNHFKNLLISNKHPDISHEETDC